MRARQQPNLLIFRIGSIGDSVVALPCLHAIARAFPGHHRILLTNVANTVRAASAHAVLDGSGLIHQTLDFPLGPGKLRHSLALARRLRQLRPEAVIYLTPRPTTLPVLRDIVFFRAAGVRTIVGAPLDARKRALRVDASTGEFEFEAQRLARLLGEAIPVDLSSPNWSLCLSEVEQTSAAGRLMDLPADSPAVALSPGAKVAAKDWGEANWAAFIDLLGSRAARLSLVFVGAPDERALAQRLSARWPGAQVNLCGLLTPRESAAVLARCDALVCHDSGPMHLAASQGTACVALFGHYNEPRRWFPFGSGHRVIYEPRGIDQIDVHTVLDALHATLQRGAAIRDVRGSGTQDGGSDVLAIDLAVQHA
jgi:heptosyltransferase-3